MVTLRHHHTCAADYTIALVSQMLSSIVCAPLEARNPGLLTGTHTNIAKSKFLHSLASLTLWVNLLAAEGSPTSPHLLPPMEPCPLLCLVWLNLACNVGSSLFGGFVFWQLCKLIKLWRGQSPIRLAQLLGQTTSTAQACSRLAKFVLL